MNINKFYMKLFIFIFYFKNTFYEKNVQLEFVDLFLTNKYCLKKFKFQ